MCFDNDFAASARLLAGLKKQASHFDRINKTSATDTSMAKIAVSIAYRLKMKPLTSKMEPPAAKMDA